ncbi:glycoside hydrolase family 18 protein [Silvibacterium acidisoli]|uniref:glycoside hydrolase family 18 protein n=1 Tax=Acidobacteriaceae bacterium ZG23-2 TaxID=2883246 RepID=UPI00406CA69E
MKAHSERIVFALLAFCLFSLNTPFAHAVTRKIAPDPPRIVGYMPEWMIYSGFYPKQLVTNGTGKELTHILYAFANLPAPGQPGAGTCQLGDPWADYEVTVAAADSVDGVGDVAGTTLHGNFNQLLKLKKKYPNLRVSISIGGWTWSSGFSAMSSTEAGRKAFVASCLNTFIAGNFTDPLDYNVTAPGIFDGIDIDWEYPAACGDTCNESPDDTKNFTLLLQEFRTQLDAMGKKTHKTYDLSFAAPTGYNATLIELAKVSQIVTFVNLMTYDLNGAWNLYADHAAPLFTSPLDPYAADKGNSVDGAATDYLKAGVPKNKLNIGLPFYGHGWIGVGPKNHGLYQPATGGAPDDQANYNVMITLPGFQHYYDPLAGMAQYMYNPGTQTFYSYDDPLSMFVKALYINQKQLGGAMIWDITGDDTRGTLLHTVYGGLSIH